MTMKSVFRERYGSPEVLEVREMPKPEPGPKDVLVRVHAATVSRTDCGGLFGTPFIYRFFVGWPRPRQCATGCDFAGQIEAVGRDVSHFRVGDRVFGFDDNVAGTHAQYVAFSASKGIAAMPAGLDYAQAAACAEGVHYALNFMRVVSPEAGKRALVNGATGTIGSAAVQLLKARGVEVTAVCATPQLALVRALGADRVIDYLTDDFTQDDARYDYVLDAVGKRDFAACKRILKADGTFVSSEPGAGGENLYLPLVTKLRGGPRVKFPFPVDIKASLDEIRSLVEQGKFKPLIDRSYPLEQIRAAFEYVASGQKIGNVLLTLD